MYTIQDIKSKFPEAHSVGGELVVRIDNQTVVLADLGNGSLNLTKKGQELMGSAPVAKAAEVKAANPRKGSKAPKWEPAEEPSTDTLDTILGE